MGSRWANNKKKKMEEILNIFFKIRFNDIQEKVGGIIPLLKPKKAEEEECEETCEQVRLQVRSCFLWNLTRKQYKNWCHQLRPHYFYQYLDQKKYECCG